MLGLFPTEADLRFEADEVGDEIFRSRSRSTERFDFAELEVELVFLEFSDSCRLGLEAPAGGADVVDRLGFFELLDCAFEEAVL